MKKLVMFLLTGMLLTLAACGGSGNGDEQSSDDQTNSEETEQSNDGQTNNEETEQNSDEEGSVPAELSKALGDVITATEELQSTVEKSPDNAEKIQEKGKMLEENWDKIEKQVEEKNPEAYENIEKSLYPLKDAAKEDKPNTEKISKLSKETKTKLQDYKKKVQS